MELTTESPAGRSTQLQQLLRQGLQIQHVKVYSLSKQLSLSFLHAKNQELAFKRSIPNYLYTC